MQARPGDFGNGPYSMCVTARAGCHLITSRAAFGVCVPPRREGAERGTIRSRMKGMPLRVGARRTVETKSPEPRPFYLADHGFAQGDAGGELSSSSDRVAAGRRIHVRLTRSRSLAVLPRQLWANGSLRAARDEAIEDEQHDGPKYGHHEARGLSLPIPAY